MKNISKSKLVLIVILSVILIDQLLKIWIKTTMMIGEEHRIFGNWFIIHFTENNGMAFGLEFFGKMGKYLLSIFRIVAVSLIAYYLTKLVKKQVSIGFTISVALIFSGALGNIIDSAFYGLLFDHSYSQVAQLFPPEGGYSGFLQGRVVDMLYFPIIQGHYPNWSPIHPSEPFIFFSPVFNIADSAITIGMSIILIWHRKTLKSLL